MGNIKLLDCTLRDGGYVNDWDFGHDNIVSVFERLVSSNVEIIEVGFLDDRRPFDIGKTITPDTKGIDKIYGDLDKGNALVVGMIDYGTCDISNIANAKDSYLDGIRVIFKEPIKEKALAYCKEIKDLGYKMFVQLVSITSYTDEQMMELIELVNNLKPYAVSMVDTYGLLHKNHLMHYYKILDKYLLPEIGLGYHSHNNFQLGYANCIEMLEAKTERMILVDGTLYGMGKSAGNTPLELLAMHLNDCYGKSYDVGQMLEAIDVNILSEYRKKSWGYTMGYYISAANDCHPSYVEYLRGKHTLSIKSVNEILQTISDERKLAYDKDYIEDLYLNYQKRDINDEDAYKNLKDELEGKNILLLGPGKSINENEILINNFIENQKSTVISTNFKPKNCKADYIFISNSKRYIQLATELSKSDCNLKTIATSNVTKTSGKFDFTLECSSLLDYHEDAIFPDNSFIMLLKVMIKVGVKKVSLAGYDGYSVEKNENYYKESMEYKFDPEKARKINEYVMKKIKEMSKDIEIEFLTRSNYE